MRRSFLHILFSTLLPVFFLSGTAISFLSGLTNADRCAICQKPDSENESPNAGYNCNTELKEIIADASMVRMNAILVAMLPNYPRQRNMTIEQLFYLAVPTPPPDSAVCS